MIYEYSTPMIEGPGDDFCRLGALGEAPPPPATLQLCISSLHIPVLILTNMPPNVNYLAPFLPWL